MRKGSLVGGLAALAIAITAMAAASRANAQAGPGTVGPWIMGPGMMGCGPGMMGWGVMGPGMMGWGWSPNTTPANWNLSVDDVEGALQRWIAIVGNPRLKVGNVTDKDANTITAEIVTTDKEALVQRFNIDRRTGVYSPAE